MGAALGSEEQQPDERTDSDDATGATGAVAPERKKISPPPHPGLLELQHRFGLQPTEATLTGGTRGVALSATQPPTASDVSIRQGVLTSVDCCVLSLGMPPPRTVPTAELEQQLQPLPPPPPPSETGGAADGPPSDPDEMRLWLQAQMGGSPPAAPEPEPESKPASESEPETETVPEAVPPGKPSIIDGWEKLYDSYEAGTALHTFGRGIAGYDGPSLLALRVRQQSSSSTPATGVIGAYVDEPWRIGEKFFGGNGSFLFGMVEREQHDEHETEHCRMFPATSSDKAAPGNVGYLCTEPRRSGGADRGVGFGGKSSRPGKATCRLWIDSDLCRGHLSLDPRLCTSFAAGDLLWWSETAPSGLTRDFEILRIEAWGCSDDAVGSLRKRDEERRRKEAAAARARKVDVRNFVDAETGRLDSGTSALLSGGEFGVKDAADLTKQTLQSQR